MSLRGSNGNSSYSEYSPMIWNLSSGIHKFTFYGRESNALLDKIILENYIENPQNIPNSAPTVTLTSPTTLQFNSGSSILISASASDSDGTISKVEFYINGNLSKTDTSSPYSYTWTNAQSGSYTILARAYDNQGGITISSPLNIVVLQAQNSPPTVSITSPSNGNYNQGSTIPVSASASDSDGTISKVEFYVNGNLIFSDSSTPYSYTWTNAQTGTYSLTAKAYDNSNAVTTSNPVTVNIVQVSTNEVSRSFSVNPATLNSVITVTLTKTLSSSQKTLLVEEYVPSGFTITSVGTGIASGNTIRWGELNDSVSGTYTYNIRTPNSATIGTFSGLFSINGGSSNSISGSTQLTVQ